MGGWDIKGDFRGLWTPLDPQLLQEFGFKVRFVSSVKSRLSRVSVWSGRELDKTGLEVSEKHRVH